MRALISKPTNVKNINKRLFFVSDYLFSAIYTFFVSGASSFLLLLFRFLGLFSSFFCYKFYGLSSGFISKFGNYSLKRSLNYDNLRLNCKLWAAKVRFVELSVITQPVVFSSESIKLISPITIVFTFQSGFQDSGW